MKKKSRCFIAKKILKILIGQKKVALTGGRAYKRKNMEERHRLIYTYKVCVAKKFVNSRPELVLVALEKRCKVYVFPFPFVFCFASGVFLDIAYVFCFVVAVC